MQPRSREITASVLVIAVLGSSAGILSGDSTGRKDEYLNLLPGEDLGGINLVGLDVVCLRNFSALKNGVAHIFL